MSCPGNTGAEDGFKRAERKAREALDPGGLAGPRNAAMGRFGPAPKGSTRSRTSVQSFAAPMHAANGSNPQPAYFRDRTLALAAIDQPFAGYCRSSVTAELAGSVTISASPAVPKLLPLTAATGLAAVAAVPVYVPAAPPIVVADVTWV